MKRLIFSRHGIRYPFFTKEKSIDLFNKDILMWNDNNVGNPDLTKKGALIELKFGQWLKNYLNIDEKSNLKVIANSTPRTYETAQLLALGLKPSQELKIICNDKTFKTENEYFANKYIDNSYIDYEKMHQFDKDSKDIYEKMNQIFKLDKNCKYNTEETSFELSHEWYKTTGPLFISSSFSDVLQLKYYSGFDEKDIFESNDFINDLKLILKAKDRVIDFICANEKLLKASKKNIYKLIKKELYKVEDTTLIVGHDMNISSILCMLDIKMPNLDQLEKYPIGSKLIFDINDDYTFNLSYVFFTYEDIRNFSMDKEPKVVLLGKNLRFVK